MIQSRIVERETVESLTVVGVVCDSVVERGFESMSDRERLKNE